MQSQSQFLPNCFPVKKTPIESYHLKCHRRNAPPNWKLKIGRISNL
jgi:hypothetical protein